MTQVARVELPPTGLGTAPLGGLFAPLNADAALATLRAAWACGIRYFDTAPHYGVGLAEERLGAFLQEVPREDIVVSTKVGRLLLPADYDVDGAEGFYGTPRRVRKLDYSRDGVLRSFEDSLGRLGVDRIDVVFVHDPDDCVDQALTEAVPALLELRDQGLVGAVGAGMNQTPALERFVREADVDCILVAGRLTLLDRSAADSLLPLAHERGVAVVVGGVFNSGILANPGAGAMFNYAQAPPEVIARARHLEKICDKFGVPLAVAARQYPMRHPGVTSVVVGAGTPDEALAAAAMTDVAIPDELWGELESARA